MRSFVGGAAHIAATCAVISSLAARPAAAQTASVSVHGRIQSQFSTVSGDSSGKFDPHRTVNSSFEVRRLRIQTDVRIGERINFVIQPSFDMGSLRMHDAYLRVLIAANATGRLGLTVGQEKRPFNRYELTSSNTLPSIERGARFRGLSGVAAQNNLLEENGYIVQDIGASADASFLANRVQLKAGLYNGSGESSTDVNNAKTYGARATATVLQDAESRPVLRLGTAFVSRDRAVTTTASSTVFTPDSSRRTSAFGFEAEWGDFRPGLHVIADLAFGTALGNAYAYGIGRNVGNLRPNTPDSAYSTFRSVQVVGAYRIAIRDPAATQLVTMIEPALRLDVTDPDADRADDGSLLITPVLNVYFSRTTVLRAGLDACRYRADGGTKWIRAIRLSWQASF